MNWAHARKLLGLVGEHRPAAEPLEHAAPEEARRAGGPRASSICVASGKGGTGKSVVAASLARLISIRGRTLVVDADLGVGNAHILQGVSGERSFVDLVEGRLEAEEIVQSCGGQVDLIAGGSGVPRMAELNTDELYRIAVALRGLELDYRFALVDSAAGVSNQTVGFAAACDVVVLVTTPDLTAMTDAYAFLKVLRHREPAAEPLLVVNRARSQDEAESVANRIQEVGERFLGVRPRWAGWVPDDPAVLRSVNRRGPVVAIEATSEAARALRILAVRVLEEVARHHPRGLGERLGRELGYEPISA